MQVKVAAAAGWVRRHALPILVSAHFLLAGLYSVTTPILEGWDEVGHFVTMRHVARPDVYPSPSSPNLPDESSQPPLYYLIVGKMAGPLLPSTPWDPTLNGSGMSREGGLNLVMRSAAEGFPYRGVFAFLHVARLLTALLSCLVTVFVFKAARLLAPPDSRLPMLAAAIASFDPTWLELSGLLNNDVLAVAGATAALYFAVRFLVKRDSHAIWVGLCTGLALLSKSTTAFLVPLFLFMLAGAIVWTVAAAHDRARALLRGGRWLAEFGLALAAVSGWWVVSAGGLGERVASQAQRFVGPRLLAAAAACLAAFCLLGWLAKRSRAVPAPLWRRWALGAIAVGLALAFLFPTDRRETHALEVGFIFRTFIASFATGVVEAPGWVYVLAGVAVAGLVLLLIGYFWCGSLPLSPAWALGLLGFVAAACFLPVARSLIDQDVLLMHGRFFMPALGAAAILLAIPLERLTRRLGDMFDALSVSGMAALALLVPFVSIVPAFAPGQALPPGSAVPRNLSMNFGGYFTLLGYTTNRTELAPGERLTITLYWRSDRATSEDWEIAVHLLDPVDQRSYAAVQNHPDNGRRPTSMWKPGEITRDVHHLALDSQTPPQIRLRIGVSMFMREKTGLRYLPSRPPAAKEGTTFLFGELRVGDRAEPAWPLRPQHLALGDAFRLVGSYPDSAALPPGSPLGVILAWNDVARTDRRYKVFVHLLDGQNRVIGQDDSEPRSNDYPTNLWSPGEVVYDAHLLRVPASYTGEARIEVGMYDRETQKRLLFGNRRSSVIIGTVDVQGRPLGVKASSTDGRIVDISWTDDTQTAAWLGLYRVGAPDASPIDLINAACNSSSGLPVEVQRCQLREGVPLGAGRYEVRLFADGVRFPALANALSVAVPPDPLPHLSPRIDQPARHDLEQSALTVSPFGGVTGGTVEVSWQGIQGVTPGDWLGLYGPGAPDTRPGPSIHVGCSERASTVNAAASCPLQLPLQAGTLEARLISAATSRAIARSAPFKVQASYVRLATSSPFTVSR